MQEYTIKKNSLEAFLASVSGAGYKLLAPVLNDKNQYLMAEIKAEELNLTDYNNTHLSPKDVFFPQTEKLLGFHKDKSKENAFIYQDLREKVENQVLFGIRPCDAKGLSVCDKVFQNDRFTDPYWKNKYEATVKIGWACTQPCASCFCTLLGGSPFSEEGLDILMAQSEDAEEVILVKSLTEKGQELLSKAQELTEEKISEKMEILKKKALEKLPVKEDLSGLEETDLMDLFKAPHWEDLAETCLNCGVCTFVCPTCHCFDIQDEENEKNGIRMRNWDTCMSWLYTIHGTGHNPRPTKKERVRQRFMHKIKYIPLKQDGCYGCIGCGRCVSLCPVNIDIRQVINEMKDRS